MNPNSKICKTWRQNEEHEAGHDMTREKKLKEYTRQITCSTTRYKKLSGVHNIIDIFNIIG
jgi:hypothetical protein